MLLLLRETEPPALPICVRLHLPVSIWESGPEPAEMCLKPVPVPTAALTPGPAGNTEQRKAMVPRQNPGLLTRPGVRLA